MVLSHGWAYGKGSGYQLEDKKVALAISAGIKKEDYQVCGRYKYTLEQLTSPFEITFLYVRADYQPFYAAEYEPTPKLVSESAEGYVRFLEAL